MKQDEEKEQLRVTSTATPAEEEEEEEAKEEKEEEEEREEEKRKERTTTKWYEKLDSTSKIVHPKNYRRDVFQVLPSGIASHSVRQLFKMSLIQYRSCITGKSGPGGIWTHDLSKSDCMMRLSL